MPASNGAPIATPAWPTRVSRFISTRPRPEGGRPVSGQRSTPASTCMLKSRSPKHWRMPWIWRAAPSAPVSRTVSCRTSCFCPASPNCANSMRPISLAAFYPFGWTLAGGCSTARPTRRSGRGWNYRKAAGGGLILDMFAHWRYIFDRLLGEVKAVSCRHMTALPERRDETGIPYRVDVEDTAFATFELAGGVLAQVSASWASRVKRDDLLQIQVDGTLGSAVCGSHRCFVQPLVATPKPFFDPERPQAMVFDEQWQEIPDIEPFRNSYRAGWELFLKHVAEDAPFPSPFLEGAKGVQLAEACCQSDRERQWVGLADLTL